MSKNPLGVCSRAVHVTWTATASSRLWRPGTRPECRALTCQLRLSDSPLRYSYDKPVFADRPPCSSPFTFIFAPLHARSVCQASLAYSQSCSPMLQSTSSHARTAAHRALANSTRARQHLQVRFGWVHLCESCGAPFPCDSFPWFPGKRWPS